tara:strand:- start:194 stop:508 length:315 start_codon:yes stop_codon:yes gene_type:complete
MSRYKNTKVTKQLNTSTGDFSYIKGTKNVVPKQNTTIYRTVPEDNTDLFIIAQEGDKLDVLAHRFYGDTHLWWFIAHVNNLSYMNVPAGTRLRIPASINNATGV